LLCTTTSYNHFAPSENFRWWRHCLTPIRIGGKHFLAGLMPLFNVQWGIFSKRVSKAIA